MSPLPRRPAAVGVDIGGTKLLVLGVADDGTVLDRRRERSPVGEPDRLIETVARVAGEVGPGLPVGVGVAGIVDRDGTVTYGPNLHVEDLPLRRRLHDQLGVPVVVGNDANVALWGEHRAGAARDVRSAAMVTLGTGVGGGLLLEGRLVQGASGYAGEIGHVIVAEGGRRCSCGNLGCVEAYSSGTAIGAVAQERLASGDEPSSLRALDRVDGRAVTRAAHDGDAFARDVLREAGRWLGVALASVVNAVDPQLVVIGGGAAQQSAGFVVPAATASLSERVLGRDRRQPPPIVLAQLGDDAGAIGAALLARELGGAP